MLIKPVVLFIDDDSFMLKALLRAAMRLHPDWHYHLSDNAAHWQAALPAGVVPDLIVSDFLMPDMQGDVVLSQAMLQMPEAVRVLMTGDTSEDVVSSVSLQSHFVLSKPFSEKDLTQLFDCIVRLRQLQLPLQLRQQLGQAGNVPVLPAIIRNLRQELTAESPAIERVVDIIAHEPMIAARLMQLANSAFLGYSRATLSLSESLLRLGLRLVESIVTLMAVEQQVAHLRDNHDHFQLSDLAFRQAGTARSLAKATQLSTEQQDLLFMSALLSALGPLSKLQLNAQIGIAVPDQLNGINSDHVLTVYLLILWGYPAEVCQLALQQHVPGQGPDVADYRPFILAITQQYYQGCSQQYLHQMAQLVPHPGLQQALRQLPQLDRP
jgi:HD-like signal output (HDOD) protein